MYLWENLQIRRNIVGFTSITNPRLCTLNDSYLYNVDIILSNNGKQYDCIHTYFGLRKIGTGRLPNSKNMYVTLNNRPIYFQMALDQSFHPKDYYTFPSDKFTKEEILRAKKLDKTRLIDDNSPDKEDHIVSDINSWHRYLPALQYSSFLDYIKLCTFNF